MKVVRSTHRCPSLEITLHCGGQFDDLETPAHRILHDDAPTTRPKGRRSRRTGSRSAYGQGGEEQPSVSTPTSYPQAG
ncbi:MAG: cbb3-type cytochrome oxidase assembly protein [Planctomycetota bacterium]